MSELEIRRAAPGDIEGLRALLSETWHDTYDALLGVDWVSEVSARWHAPENLRRQLDAPETAHWVAVRGGAPIGTISTDAREFPLVVITRLYVLPAHQRGGVGRQLIHTALAAHAGAERLRLDVDAANDKGVAFYRREGFIEVGRRTIEGSEHLVMETRLTR